MNKTTNNKINVQQLTAIALMASVICVLGPLSIPVGVIPISFTNLAIYLAMYALGTTKGTISYMIYLLIGLIGLPVFSGFSSGPGKLMGPTGGYLIGFIFMALICGLFIDKFLQKRFIMFIGLVLGTLIAYAFGTIWLAFEAGMSFEAALAAGVIPFIPGDLIKIIIAVVVGPQIRKQLIRANLFI